jgi:hypothetical protein
MRHCEENRRFDEAIQRFMLFFWIAALPLVVRNDVPIKMNTAQGDYY